MVQNYQASDDLLQKSYLFEILTLERQLNLNNVTTALLSDRHLGLIITFLFQMPYT